MEASSIEKAIRTFETRGIHPDLLGTVEEIKTRAALLLAIISTIPSDNAPEVGRLKSIAMTELEMSVMCAVKALSRCQHNG